MSCSLLLATFVHRPIAYTFIYKYSLLAGCCAYAHQQWCAVRGSTSLLVLILTERKLYTLCKISALYIRELIPFTALKLAYNPRRPYGRPHVTGASGGACLNRLDQ